MEIKNYRKDFGYKYPERSDQHMIEVPHQKDTNFDENYKYYKKGKWWNFLRFCLRVVNFVVVFPVMYLVHGIRIVGKQNIKNNKKLIKNGVITICNHVFMWDFIGLMMALKPRLSYFPAWATNLEGPNRVLIHWTGGVPIPKTSLKAVKKFNEAITQIIEDKNILHFYPEGSMWYFYPDIRPFKQTVFKLAVKHNKAIIPMGYSYREPKGLFKIWKRRPCITLNIGEPIFPNESLPVAERINELQKVCYIKVQELVGIKPGDPTYNENQDIDTYKKTM